MSEHRRDIDDASGIGEVSAEFLATQRRAIYAKLSVGRRSPFPAWITVRWASAAAATIFVVGGSVFFVEENSQTRLHTAIQQQQARSAAISDAQLSTEVSQMADAYEPEATEPLQALFAE